MLIFEMGIEEAEEYYRRKEALGALTEIECTAILLEMVRDGLIKRAWHTDRNKRECINDWSKEFNVLEVDEWGGEDEPSTGC